MTEGYVVSVINITAASQRIRYPFQQNKGRIAMMGKRIVLLLGLTPALAGCATLSFAPPKINSSDIMTNDGKCKNNKEGAISPRTVIGALDLIENYSVAYGCAAQQLANGRQIFEVPSALALAGGAAAAAFGAGPDVAIATGAGSAVLNHGNSYYAPKAKAHIVAAAYNAVTCIKQEASGLTALNVSAGESVSRQAVMLAQGAPSISFSPSVQYYQMVSASLQNVHSILGERLSSVGSYAPDAIAKEIQQLAAEKSDAESKPDAGNNATNAARAAGLSTEEQAVYATSIVELNKLQPRLKLCVVAAKAG